MTQYGKVSPGHHASFTNQSLTRIARNLCVILTLVLAGCGVPEEGDLTASVEVYEERSPAFIVTRRAPFQQEITPLLHQWWDEVNHCLGETFEPVQVEVAFIDGNEVRPGIRGQAMWNGRRIVSVIDRDLYSGEITKHEFQHIIRGIRGDSAHSNMNHIDWAEC